MKIAAQIAWAALYLAIVFGTMCLYRAASPFHDAGRMPGMDALLNGTTGVIAGVVLILALRRLVKAFHENPERTAAKLRCVFGSILFGSLVGGVYGALHDQISYSISPEYFTKMKFHQFAYANFGWAPRVFAGEVGFLASWWVGLIAGWILGRTAYDILPIERVAPSVLRAFAILTGIAALSGALGILLGIYSTQGNGVEAWADWRDELMLKHPREFAIVAWLHAWSYLGAGVGLAAAVGYLFRVRAAVYKVRIVDSH